jgi:hypothetical protein
MFLDANLPLLIKTVVIEIEPTIIQDDFTLIWLYLQKLYFQIRSQSQVPRLQLQYICLGDKIQPIRFSIIQSGLCYYLAIYCSSLYSNLSRNSSYSNTFINTSSSHSRVIQVNQQRQRDSHTGSHSWAPPHSVLWALWGRVATLYFRFCRAEDNVLWIKRKEHNPSGPK